MRKTKISVLSVAALSAALVFDALACTVAIVGKKASTTGCVIVGHNEDNAMVRVRHGLVPARDWPVGAVLPAEPGMAAIPQAPRTLGFFWSQMKSAEGHVPAGDSFLNEKGVLVVSDNAGPTKVDPADGSRLTDGGVFYNLRRAVAERATSARDAVRVVGELVERWGYAPPGRIYTVADADEGWMVQVVGCRQWVARRCPDDAIAVCPNHYTIHSIPPEPTDDCLYSSNLVAHAVAKGWWPSDRPFDFAAAYQATNWWKIAHNTGRQTLLTSLLLGRAWRDESYPFCVKAARKVSPEDVKAALCAHGAGGGKPHVDDFDRPALCRAQTVESLVCAYAKPLSETVLHVSGHHPCTSGYKAVRPLSGEPLPAAFDDGDAAARLDAHLAKSPTNGVFAAFDGFGDAPPVDLGDAVYAWGYVLDRTPTACPFVTGETDWSLERAAEFLNAKKTIYMNSMFNRGYVAKHFRSWDESCFTNVIDGRLSEAQIAKVAKSREIWCALEHDARESSADRIAKLSLKHPNVVGINLDDFNNGTPATAMTPLELKALRERVHAVNPKLKIMVVSYAHPPMRCDLTPFRGLIDVVSRWCWKPTSAYWDDYLADVAKLRAEVGAGVPILQGLYLVDFGTDMDNPRPQDAALFEKSVRAVHDAILNRKLDGVIVPQAGWFGKVPELTAILKKYGF